jgi:hypothetical protein
MHRCAFINQQKQRCEKSELLEDLEYWRGKMQHFKKTNNPDGIKVSKLILDKYLDKYNKITT